jgi:hypothetical protein
MDSKINSQDTGLRVQIDQARTRQAPRTDFGSVMSTGLSRTTDAVLNAGQLAAPFIPGGAVLSAAVTGVGSLKSSAGASTNATSAAPNSNSLSGAGMSGSVSGSGGSTYSTGGGSTAGVSATGGPTDMMTAAKQMQELNMSFNMQYLMLQQKMQADNRQFTTLSNIMKTKHDTAKNAINNVR